MAKKSDLLVAKSSLVGDVFESEGTEWLFSVGNKYKNERWTL